MKVLHITPKHLDKLSWGDDDANFGLAHHYLINYAISRLDKRIIQFKICTGDEESYIDSFDPDIVAISSLTFNFEDACRISNYAKKKNRAVIIGGHHISACPTTLDENMDIGIIGEGEITYLEIIKNYYDNKQFANLNDINGIVYRLDNELHFTEPRAFIKDLDSIGHINRTQEYFNKSIERSLFTSRGCIYECVFCGSCVHWKNKIRFHSAEYVIKEIENIYNFSDTNYIRIEDVMFTINKPRLIEILNLWKSHPLYNKIRFAVNGRANHIDEEMGSILKEFGVDTVFIGFESNSDEVLTYLKKRDASSASNQKAYDVLSKLDITIYGSFIIGSPLDTHSNIEDSYDFVLRNEKMVGYLCNLVPLPGTEIDRYASEKGLLKKNYSEYVASYSVSDVENDRYIHLCPNLTKSDLIHYLNKFGDLFAGREKSKYKHTSKFR